MLGAVSATSPQVFSARALRASPLMDLGANVVGFCHEWEAVAPDSTAKIPDRARANAFVGKRGRKSRPCREEDSRSGEAAARKSFAWTSYFAPSISAAKKMPICFALAEPIPGPTTEALAKVARETQAALVVSLFERRAAGIYHNSAVVIDADGSLLGPLPQDAHPGRSALLRKILFHSGRPRISRFRHALCAHRRADLLGPVVSGGRAIWSACRARK